MPSFKKIERLCSKKAIEALFGRSKSKTEFPVKLVYTVSAFESPYPARVMFVVPKKKIRRANRRNVMKRRMREVYRLHKEELYRALEGKQIDLGFIYLQSEELSYAELEQRMKRLLTFLGSTNFTSGNIKP